MCVAQAPTYRLAPGRSLYLGGLARLDYANTDQHDSILVTWFGQLGVHTTNTAGTRNHPHRQCVALTRVGHRRH